MQDRTSSRNSLLIKCLQKWNYQQKTITDPQNMPGRTNEAVTIESPRDCGSGLYLHHPKFKRFDD